MAEPKKRLTKSRSGNRRSHIAKKPNQLATCQKCKSKILPHHVCPVCGTYKGEKIIEVK
ncbi:MAG: 50S ribosomal protein L32 [Candidatus Nealsonbacteria bacterium CG23_combo_of_CG06-09_8_20_14_all_40_13]|uniref:Large ribosomal subunit protein bL32 n=1 Tax=Candidatus Nealsonbacteria bacterium CG23_combo_of_CG06-09_8_20_14_all_40_13 TaxID=1974724 RepID=A0A2G9YQY9_9BACT|nr:MAG: 50S ribosomal protein L32 [Candidatus Nealsonbacteria bacterium CG23_combo_of_CG06-09_8_20_14_all_40_13]PIR70869.1 MAG: 50S ribosomal protein L32 [Candidatus Nealsonbacteria bacterium CG10_big_fil_rev_8_21_14_0_10_40_24]